jgi:ribosome-binding factor A
MHHEFGREERVGAEIRRELALLLREDVNDPRIGNPTIQEVRVGRDLSQAKVYFTVLDEGQAKQTGQALQKAAAFLRRRLGERLKLRTIPQLHFVYDKSVNEGMRLSALIEEAVSHDRQSHGED